jgi:hypothetical protein
MIVGLWLILPIDTYAVLPWSADTGFRSLAVSPAPSGKLGFTVMEAKAMGISFTNQLTGDAYLTNAVAHNGSGVAIGDVDSDGWADVYLCNLQGPNRLYRNLGGWRFEEMELGEAACANQYSTGAVLADVDGDWDLDLLVNGIAVGTRLFMNDGKGKFAELEDSGLSRKASATSMALADIDGDGDLDLYCTHYIDVMHLADPTVRFSLARRGDRWEVTKVNGESSQLPRWKDRFEALPDGSVRELPETHGLYRNDGHGHFTMITHEQGVFMDSRGTPISPFRDWGLAVMFRDLNRDGAPDMYVCNDNASPDRLWINSGKGTFRLADSFMLRHTSRSSMGIDFADLDRDGHDDFIVLDMLARDHEKRMTQLMKDLPDAALRDRIEEQPRYNRNALFFGRGDGSFVEAAFMAGVAASDWSFCPVFLDVDLDGYEDLLISNGFSFDVMDQDSHDLLRQRQRQLTQAQLKRARQFHPAWPTPNAAFRNRGDGQFEPMDQAWGFNHRGVSYGIALGDLDNDGDLDVVVNNLNETPSFYRNDASGARIEIRLKGLPPNTQGIGARMRLTGGPVPQSQEMICGGRYCSGDQAARVFAAMADPGKPLELEVTWRNGDLSRIPVSANRIYEVDQAASAAHPIAGPTNIPAKPYFIDVSSLLGHAHSEAPFDDSSTQRLLPRRLSRMGPGLSWYDLDGDGWEDLVITGGRGSKLAIYRNEQGRRFQSVPGPPAVQGEQGAVVGWPDGRGNRQMLVARSGYGNPADPPGGITGYRLTNLAAPQSWPAGTNSPGPLALADIDGDGDLDLFVGGRFHPGRYPAPVASTLWLNEGGVLQMNATLSQAFASLGLVSGATFCDLDSDGSPDLALAVEWGPVRVFHNEHGRFVDQTVPWGLAGRTGWWTSIAAGDFDGDGRMDLAVGNWGRNGTYELYQPGPLRIFYGAWNNDESLGLVEAWKKSDAWYPVRNRAWLETGLPELRQQFPTHQAYGRATVMDILGPQYAESQFVESTCLESGVFLNRGARFQWIPFPREAQFAPTFSVNVGDFDGDGKEDIFLAQNFFGASSEMNRDDGGRGLWLRGNGDGKFSALDAGVSGIQVYGEQRGAALADFDHDGRVDLAVSQNNAPTKLYLNQGGKRGIRVVVHGRPGNPDGIGVQMRVVYEGGQQGPCRLVQAGSGYWSQDASAQILGLAGRPAALWLRLPNGKEQTVTVGPDLWEIQIEP